MTNYLTLLCICAIPAIHCLKLIDDFEFPAPVAPPTAAPIYTPVDIINDVIEQIKLTSDIDEKRVMEITAITNKVLEAGRLTSTNIDITSPESVQDVTDNIVKEVMVSMGSVTDKVADAVDINFITSKAPTPSPVTMIDDIVQNILKDLNLD